MDGFGKPFALAVPDYSELGIQKPYFGDGVWKHLREKDAEGFSYVPIAVEPFADGSYRVEVKGSTRFMYVYLIHSLYTDPMTHFFLGGAMVSALRRAGADKVFVMDSYNPLFRQDQRDHLKRQNVATRDVADRYWQRGASRVITFDIHNAKTEAAFSDECPLDTIFLSPFLADFIKTRSKHNFGEITQKKFFVSPPDDGSVSRSSVFAESMNLHGVKLKKRRTGKDETECLGIAGDREEVDGKTGFIRDDIVGTGRTVSGALNALRDTGAEKLYLVATHVGLYKGEGILDELGLHVIGTNTIPQPARESRVEICDIEPLAGEFIYRATHRQSLTDFMKRDIEEDEKHG